MTDLDKLGWNKEGLTMLIAPEFKPDIYEGTLNGAPEKSDTEAVERALTPALKDGQMRNLIRHDHISVQNQWLRP